MGPSFRSCLTADTWLSHIFGFYVCKYTKNIPTRLISSSRNTYKFVSSANTA